MNTMVRFIIYAILTLLCLSQIVSSIDPIKCTGNECFLQNYQGMWVDRKLCRVASVEYPTTEQELLSAVAKATKLKQKIKVVSKLSHSLPKFACPGGETGMLISTAKYNSRIEIDTLSRRVTVDAGVQLHDLLDKLAEKQLALPCAPSFSGISVAGVISTGAHGSSLEGKGGALNEHVTGITLVIPASEREGYAKVIKLTEGHPDLNAARLSLGVLGAISQVTLEVEPMFKRSITFEVKDDGSLEEDILRVIKGYTFGEINWSPYQRKIRMRLDNRVSATTPGEGRSTFGQPSPVSTVRQWRVQEEEMMASNKTCSGISKWEATDSSGGGFVDGSGSFRGYPVIGFNHLMETGGGCQNGERGKTCYWDPEVPGQLFFHTSMAIPLNKIAQAISDIKKIRDVAAYKMCTMDSYGGANFRTVKGSTAYLASSEDSVFFEMMYFRDRRENVPRPGEDAMEEIEQMLLSKYNARPHYGKNRNFAFGGIATKVVDLNQFLEVKQRMDPLGLFSSEWSDSVLYGNAGVSKDYCALEGLCVCSEDKHCAPEAGYLCKPGVVFKETRVCAKAA